MSRQLSDNQAANAVHLLEQAVRNLDQYRETTGRHGVADLMLFEDLQSREDEDLEFSSAVLAMCHVLKEGLNVVEFSFFGDEATMQFDHDQMHEFMVNNDLITEEGDEE